MIKKLPTSSLTEEEKGKIKVNLKREGIDHTIKNLEDLIKISEEFFGKDRFDFKDSVFISLDDKITFYDNEYKKSITRKVRSFIKDKRLMSIPSLIYKMQQDTIRHVTHTIFNNFKYLDYPVYFIDPTFEEIEFDKIIEIKCNKHDKIIKGQISKLYDKHHVCPMCIANSRGQFSYKQENIELYKTISNQVHNNAFDYSETILKGVNCKITVICNTHGRFYPNPNDHLNGTGCKQCSHENPVQKMSITQIQDKIFKAHGTDIDSANMNYVNMKEPFEVKCTIHNNIFQTTYQNLVTMNINSCSQCLDSRSNGENKVFLFLDKLSLKIREQKKFKGCVDKRQLSFDFYLEEINACIEFDGTQHFRPVQFTSDTSYEDALSNYISNIRRDNIKDEYCKKYNIHLLRIHYNDISKIEIIIKDFFSRISEGDNIVHILHDPKLKMDIDIDFDKQSFENSLKKDMFKHKKKREEKEKKRELQRVKDIERKKIRAETRAIGRAKIKEENAVKNAKNKAKERHRKFNEKMLELHGDVFDCEDSVIVSNVEKILVIFKPTGDIIHYTPAYLKSQRFVDTIKRKLFYIYTEGE